MKLLFFLLFPLVLISQGKMKVETGINVVSTNNPIINLYNTDLYNNTGDADFSTNTIWSFSGNVPQNINGTNIANFYGLRLNNINGYTLSENTVVTNLLEMVGGNLDLNGHTLEIGTSPSNPGEINWTNGTIIGPIKRWFAPSVNSTQSSGIFPIGNNSTNRNITINYTEAPTTGGYIIAEYKTGIPTQADNYSGLPLWTSDGQVVQNYDDGGYFEITPDNYNGSLNNSKFTIKLRGVNIGNVNDYTSLRLIKNPGPSHNGWVPCGTHSTISGVNTDFTVTSTDVVGFSWFNFGGNNNNPLPVELTLFDGIPYPLFNVIKWTTASEHNSSYFILEKSFDGENWEFIVNKPAAGHSTQEIGYSHIDNNRNSLTYYRLQQFDFDGQSKTYGPIAITKSVTDKKVVKYINLLGQEINPDETSGVVIEIYEDGTMKKTIR